MKRLLSPWPFVSDSFEAGRYSPRSVIRFEFCKVDRGGGGGGAACGANRKFYYRDTRMTDTPATKQSGENSFLPRRVSFGWKETFDEEELCSGFVNSRILYTRSFRREKFLPEAELSMRSVVFSKIFETSPVTWNLLDLARRLKLIVWKKKRRGRKEEEERNIRSIASHEGIVDYVIR